MYSRVGGGTERHWVSQRGRGFYRCSGEGEAWLKQSTPMETNKILVLSFFICTFIVVVVVCFLFTSKFP